MQPNPSPLKFQMRSLARFTVGTGFAVGSVEGRSSICNMSETGTHMVSAGSFSFKWYAVIVSVDPATDRVGSLSLSLSRRTLICRVHMVAIVSVPTFTA